jgi:DNA-binding HxlR family transcriptional regulator
MAQAAVKAEAGRVCSTVERAFALLGKKWAGLIVHVLAGGPRHFCEVQQAIGSLSARMLAARMKELEAEGLVARTVETGSPVRVRYALTEKGRALEPALRGVEQWARKWMLPVAKMKGSLKGIDTGIVREADRV